MSGAPQRFDETWVKLLQDHVGAYKHAEFGLGTSMMRAQRYGYTQMINNAILTNSSYKLRFAQDLTLYLGDLGLDIDGFDLDPARSIGWKTRSGRAPAMPSNPSWASSDYLEQYFATNVIFEPMVGELFRSGFLMRLAAAQNDYMSPVIASAAEADYEHNLANADRTLLDARAGSTVWRSQSSAIRNMGAGARQAGDGSGEIAPADMVSAACEGDTFDTAFDLATSRLRAIATEIGFDTSTVVGT